MSEIIVNPYSGEILSVVADTLDKFGITRQRLRHFLVSDYWSNTLTNYEEGIDHISFDHCLEQWLENN